jgi:hypothetical protein
VRDAARARGRFDAVATGVDSTTGAVAFRVTPASLIAAPATPGRRRPGHAAGAPYEPLKSFLPVH